MNGSCRRLSKREPLDGVENEAFEMDPPKSPWRYPFRQTVFREPGTPKQTREEPVRNHLPMIRSAKYPFNRQISADSQDSGKRQSVKFANLLPRKKSYEVTKEDDA